MKSDKEIMTSYEAFERKYLPKRHAEHYDRHRSTSDEMANDLAERSLSFVRGLLNQRALD